MGVRIPPSSLLNSILILYKNNTIKNYLVKLEANFEGLKKYGINSVWLFLEKIVRMVLSLFITAWVARYLGVEQYGILSFGLAIIAVGAGFADIGLTNIVIRDLVKNKANLNQIMGTSFVLRTLSGILLFAIVYVLVFIVSKDKIQSSVVYILSISIFFVNLKGIGDFFYAVSKTKYFAFANFLAVLVSSSIKIFFIVNQFELVYFAYAWVTENLIIGLLLLYYFQGQKLSIKKWKFCVKTSYSLLKSSWPIVASSVAILVYMRTDIMMIRYFLDEKSIGEYATAVTLSEAWYIFPTIIISAIAPSVVNSKKIGIHIYHLRLQRLYDFFAFFTLFFGCIIFFFSDFIIQLIFGLEFMGASSVLKIHIFCGIFVFFGLVRSIWLINENLQYWSSVTQICGALSNIVLNYFFIPKYGTVGAAYGTLISFIIIMLIVPVFIPKLRLSLKMIFIAYWNIFTFKVLNRRHFTTILSSKVK